MVSYLFILTFGSFVYLVYFFNIRPSYVYKRAVRAGTISSLSLNENQSAFVPSSVLIISIILLSVKTFLFELVTIPSESMLPNFNVGQKVLVKKNDFGYRNPLNNALMSSFRQPLRGEPVVTQFPLNTQIMFIKRVIGLPGDHISLDERALTINEKSYSLNQLEQQHYKINDKLVTFNEYQVSVGSYTWKLIVDANKSFPLIEHTEIPIGGYFLLGDNLTGSSDSRFFGPIPIDYFIGSVM